MIKGKIIRGEYFDSVSLMIASQKINQLSGIKDASIVMATNENKSILKAAGLYLSEFDNTQDADLIIVITADQQTHLESAFLQINDILANMRKKDDDDTNFLPRSIDAAVKQMPDANLCLISIAGKYAVQETWNALNNNLHVMLFSDNISVKDEIELKIHAKEKSLLLMGPDCGTAIINGIPLAFANVVSRGKIGIVGASGTGIQEVSSIISNLGQGISQALGTGGRDVKKEVGGIMFIEAIKALNNDPNTEIIVLVSKPPHDEVITKISHELKNVTKPVVAIFIGGSIEKIQQSGAIPAQNLEEAALFAVAIANGQNIETAKNEISTKYLDLKQTAQQIAKNIKGKYIRGLFSGGTLCDEAQLILKNYIGNTYSNTPLNPEYKLADLWKSQENTIIDLGDDDFTNGRPHPMIDYSLRMKRMLEEAQDSETAIILIDIVLGYGSHLDPEVELITTIQKTREINPNLLIIATIVGTDRDPQNKQHLKQLLIENNVFVTQSNAEAATLAGEIIFYKKN